MTQRERRGRGRSLWLWFFAWVLVANVFERIGIDISGFFFPLLIVLAIVSAVIRARRNSQRPKPSAPTAPARTPTRPVRRSATPAPVTEPRRSVPRREAPSRQRAPLPPPLRETPSEERAAPVVVPVSESPASVVVSRSGKRLTSAEMVEQAREKFAPKPKR